MEAATPLRKPHVRTVGDRLAVDGLVIDDEAAVRLAREREEAGEDPVAVVVDAIEIGARVLDREQAGANAEYVKAEFGKVSKEVEHAFAERARAVAEFLDKRVDEVFGPENGQLAKELEKLFSDGSSASVQNLVERKLTEAHSKYREDLLKQFSAADESNPLADFKKGALDTINQAAARSDASQRALLQKIGELERRLQVLVDENEKLEELEAERERGTAKGRTFEEQVADALDAIADGQGDVAEPVGDAKGATGKVGDVLVAIDACNGPARGRIVFEAKNQKLSRPKAIEELDGAMRERDADFAVLVVPGEEQIPARMHELREYNGDKLIVTLDPDDDSALALGLGYRLARARVLARSSTGDLDAAAVRDTLERALAELQDKRRVKSQLTGARKGIDNAEQILEAMAERVGARLEEIDSLLGAEEGQPAQASLGELD